MIKNSLFKERAAKLKAAGIWDIDLRKKPSEYQKRRARELYNRFNPIMQYPEDYTVRIVNKVTAKNIDLDKQRIKTKSGKVKLYIPNPGKKKVKINRDGTVTIGKITDGITKKVYKGGRNIFKTAEKIFKSIPKNNDGFRTYVMVSIGGNAPFERIFTSLADFEFYLRNWEPKDSEDDDEEERESHKSYLIRHMNIVRVKSPEGYFNEGTGHAPKKKRKTKNRRY